MLKVIDHPLIKHKLTVMRKKETGTKDFRQNLDEFGGLMVYEITRDLPLKPIEIETPICQYTGYNKDYQQKNDRIRICSEKSYDLIRNQLTGTCCIQGFCQCKRTTEKQYYFQINRSQRLFLRDYSCQHQENRSDTS